MRMALFLLLFGSAIQVCLAQDSRGAKLAAELPRSSSGTGALPNPSPEPDLPVLPINLPVALRLANSNPIDVQVAEVRVKAAVAALDLAWAQWLPTISLGGDYARHDGAEQASDGTVTVNSHSNLMFGLGTGIGSANETLSFNAAIFGPLVARQVVRAREADVQAAVNDSMLAVTDAYFNVEQSRGELAGTIDAVNKTQELLRRVRKLASGLIPPLEIIRTERELVALQAAELVARERWQVAGAELIRVLRLQATAQVEPVEPPQLLVNLIDLRQSIDDLIVMGLTSRPELASRQAQVQAALALLRQEKYRPLMPSLLVRGYSTPASGTLTAGYFAGGTNGTLGGMQPRGDIDVQLLWQLDNLGFGNLARIHLRHAQHEEAELEFIRTQDRVVAEVTQAYAQARQQRPAGGDQGARSETRHRILREKRGRPRADAVRRRVGANGDSSAGGPGHRAGADPVLHELLCFRRRQQPRPVPPVSRPGTPGPVSRRQAERAWSGGNASYRRPMKVPGQFRFPTSTG